MAGDDNLKRVLNRPKRYAWLIKQIIERNYKVGAEIGCQAGNTTSQLLRHCPNLRLYAVDLWGPVPKHLPGGEAYYADDFQTQWIHFYYQTKPYRDRLIILKGVSWLMAEKVEDNSLDFIFIDASHEYEPVCNDILAWTPKLKPGGLLSGHDWDIPGVMAAINEYIPTWKDSGVNKVWYAKKEDLVVNKVNCEK